METPALDQVWEAEMSEVATSNKRSTMAMYEQYIEDEFEELGIEADLVDTQIQQPGQHEEIGEPEFETKQITKVVPYQPGKGLRQNIVHNYVTQNGNQIAYTIKERPQCPSCEYILSGEDERKHPTRCSEDNCHNWTCPSCASICDACTNTLCDEHSYGHGVKDGTYCEEDFLDVDEQVEHERRLEEEEQKYQQKLGWIEQRRQTIKDKKQEERQDRKLEAEIRQQKAETALKIVQQLQQQQSDTGGYPELPEEVQRIQQLTQND